LSQDERFIPFSLAAAQIFRQYQAFCVVACVPVHSAMHGIRECAIGNGSGGLSQQTIDTICPDGISVSILTTKGIVAKT
jgi:hypothetical protein